MGKLEGKVAIVTGASRGIGAEIARVFATEGGSVVCAARTMKEGEHPFEGSLETTCNGIKDAGGEASGVAVNLSLPEDCERLVEEAQQDIRPGGRACQQCGAGIFHANTRVSPEPVDAHLGGERPCSLPA